MNLTDLLLKSLTSFTFSSWRSVKSSTSKIYRENLEMQADSTEIYFKRIKMNL